MAFCAFDYPALPLCLSRRVPCCLPRLQVAPRLSLARRLFPRRRRRWPWPPLAAPPAALLLSFAIASYRRHRLLSRPHPRHHHHQHSPSSGLALLLVRCLLGIKITNPRPRQEPLEYRGTATATDKEQPLSSRPNLLPPPSITRTSNCSLYTRAKLAARDDRTTHNGRQDDEARLSSTTSPSLQLVIRRPAFSSLPSSSPARRRRRRCNGLEPAARHPPRLS